MKAKLVLLVTRLLLLFTISLLLSNTCTMAQTNSNVLVNSEAVAVLTRYEVKQGHQKKFRKVLRKYINRAYTKHSNIMAEGYYEQENPSVLWTIERWSHYDKLDKMKKGKSFKLVKLVSRKKLLKPAKQIFIRDMEPLSRDEWHRTPQEGDKPITIVLFVDSKPGTQNHFKEVYHAAMPQFRSEAGVINYQISQLEEDSTQFVTYEKFRNEDAFQYHLNFPPIQPVIDYLNTSIKKQPFQTGLHRLIEFAPLTHKQRKSIITLK